MHIPLRLSLLGHDDIVSLLSKTQKNNLASFEREDSHSSMSSSINTTDPDSYKATNSGKFGVNGGKQIKKIKKYAGKLMSLVTYRQKY